MTNPTTQRTATAPETCTIWGCLRGGDYRVIVDDGYSYAGICLRHASEVFRQGCVLEVTRVRRTPQPDAGVWEMPQVSAASVPVVDEPGVKT